MSYELETIHTLPDAEFRRLLGVKRATYAAMLAELEQRHAAKKKPSRPPVLTLEEHRKVLCRDPGQLGTIGTSSNRFALPFLPTGSPRAALTPGNSSRGPWVFSPTMPFS